MLEAGALGEVGVRCNFCVVVAGVVVGIVLLDVVLGQLAKARQISLRVHATSSFPNNSTNLLAR